MSILKTCKMENFRGYGSKNNAVTFRPGINLILGDNATGKSTIVTAVLFNLLHKRIDVSRFEQYRTLEPKDMRNFTTELTVLGTDGKEYAIIKTLRDNKIHIAVKCDGKEMKKIGELELGRPRDAQQFILEKLGTTAEILEDVLIQIQDPSKVLWPVGEPKEVGKHLSRLLRLEPLQNIYTSARSVSRWLEKEVENCRKEVESVEKDIKELGIVSPEIYEKEMETKIGKLQAQKQTYEKQSRERSALKKSIGEMSQKYIKLKEDLGRRETLTQQQAQIRKEVKGRKKPKKASDVLKIECEKLEERREALQEELNRLEGEVGKFKEIKDDAEEDIKKEEREREGRRADKI